MWNWVQLIGGGIMGHSSRFCAFVRVVVVVGVSALALGSTVFGADRWSAATPLNSDAAIDHRMDQGNPELAADDAGHRIAMWTARDLVAPDPSVSYVFFACSDDWGATWTPPARLDPNAGPDDYDSADPHIATDNNGTWIAVWTTFSGLKVSRSTDSGITWSPSVSPGPANDAPVPGVKPRIATDRQGNWMIACVVGPGLWAYVTHSSDNGLSWGPPVMVDAEPLSETGGQPTVDIGTDRLGNWIVAGTSLWQTAGEVSSDIRSWLSTDNGATWSPPVRVNVASGAPAGVNMKPRIASDCHSNWLMVWDNWINASVISARSSDSGQSWAPAVVVNNPADAGNHHNSAIVTDGNGNWIVAWYRHTIAYNPAPQGTETVLVSRSSDAGQTWNDAVALGALGTFESQVVPLWYVPGIVSDGAGHWVIAWNSMEYPPPQQDDVDIMCSHLMFPEPANGPDLTGSWAAASYSIKGTGARQRVSVKGTFIASNTGTVAAGTSVLRIELVPPAGSGGTKLKEFRLARLAPQTAHTFSFTSTLSSAGSLTGYTLKAIVDSGNTVAETDESNNVIFSYPLP
jgi:hypothetical protein